MTSFLPGRKKRFSKQRSDNIHHRISMWSGPRLSFTPPRDWRTRTSRHDWIRRPRSCVSGVNASSNAASKDSRKRPGEADRLAFPPEAVIEIKSLACELPHTYDLPLSRFSMADLKAEAIRRGLVASIGETTIWRWLSEDAIRPWRHRSWIFPRDPQFAEKAGRILDLEGIWEGRPLGDADCVLSTDEKTSIQTRRRKHPSLPPASRRSMRVEHEYGGGAVAYLAAWDVRRAHIFGRCEPTTGIVPFERLRAGHGSGTVPLRSPSVLDHGQRFLAPGATQPCPADGKMAQHRSRSYASPCQLAEPGGNLFLRDSAEGSDTE